MYIPLISLINGTDCIGDSRFTINQNFSALDVGVRALSSASYTLSGTQVFLLEKVQTLQTNLSTLSSEFKSTVPVLSTTLNNLQTQFNTQNIGPSATLTTYVSSLSVYTSTGSYIGFIPIYVE
jgi:hypothetical protein